MGYSQADKAQTHQRLLQAASAQFREHGIDGISLADLMKQLGLTHGGFYKHFESRDELVSETLDLSLAEGEQTMRDLLFKGGKPNLPRFVKSYLSETHRDSRASGCTFAALSADIARKGEDLQTAMADQVERNLAMLGAALNEVPEEQRRSQAMLTMSILYGALMVARAVGDCALSRELLRTAREHLLAPASITTASRGAARNR